MRDCRHDEVDWLSILGNHLAFEVIEVALSDQFAQPTVGVFLLVSYAHEIGNRAAQHFVAREAQFTEPMIRDRDDQTAPVDGVQHRWRRSIQCAVLEVRSCLVGQLRVHGHGAQILTLRVILDKCVRNALDDLARRRDE